MAVKRRCRILRTVTVAAVSFGAVKVLAHLYIKECEQVVLHLIDERRAGRNSEIRR